MLRLFQLLLLLASFDLRKLQSIKVPFRAAKLLHNASTLDRNEILKLAHLTNIKHMNKVLDNICIPRVVGTANHTKVGLYIQSSMTSLDWAVESNEFEDHTPLGVRKFVNVIATLNPNATRYLTLACHYDSKYMENYEFVGATDSAVPCMQLINLAKVMDKYLKTIKYNELSLMLLFLDGEEAFETWGPTDSLYGARHLASKWQSKRYYADNEENLTELDKIDLFVLLDLIGARNPNFYNYFKSTAQWYSLLSNIETTLAKMGQLEKYRRPQNKYFQDFDFLDAGIEDDHLPFLEKNVSVLHLIPYPFPHFWHTAGDNRDAIDLVTIENINKILRIFVAEYLNIKVEGENVQSGEHLEL